MITKKDLADFMKEACSEAPFDGCKFTDLGCADNDSNELYLVFAYEDEKLWCKIAYNCDDLQCDYDWDWLKPENLDYECDDCHDWTGLYAEKAAEWIIGYLLAPMAETDRSNA